MDGIARQVRREDVEQASMLVDQLLRMPLPQVRAYFRENLERHGTDVVQNDIDPQGDGDQSRVTPEHAQFYRDMFACGGDINNHVDDEMQHMSDFSKLCLSGNHVEVKRQLERVDNNGEGPPPSELIELLETRETSLRLSPLLMMVSIGKNVASPGVANSQMKVAKLLLQYGARAEARDVCGKTVCHYGMGVMATQTTMEISRMCAGANKSSHLFGKLVELHGLQSTELNGEKGWCRGYNVDTSRRAVYLTGLEKTVAIKHNNLKLVDDGASEEFKKPRKLCDIPDRLGAVCLLEVIQGDRERVAMELLRGHQADLDIQDCDGVSPRSLSLKTAAFSKTAALVNKQAGMRGKEQRETNERTCSNCGVVERKGSNLFQACAICQAVRYCSKECQVHHWKKGGHKKVCKDMAARNSVAIVLEQPSGNQFHSSISTSTGKSRGIATEIQREGSGYRKPSNVKVDEKFDLKVQGGGPTTPLMVYDKSKECNFMIHPGKRGFPELLKAVQAEPTWQGRKTFVTASFDAEGSCTVYPGLTSVKKW